jgi:acetylornithine/succinyldiaminopimelate/putrescine aminotransferase
MDRVNGSYLSDSTGNRHLDLIVGLGVNTLGRSLKPHWRKVCCSR